MDLVALAAGGSGGHVFPALALAEELKSRGIASMLFTDARGRKFITSEECTNVIELPAMPWTSSLLGRARVARVLVSSILAARRHLSSTRPSCFVGFGGYPSVAPALAARSKGIPLILHEQASRLSLANRKLLRIATLLATSFPATLGAEKFPRDRIVHTGNPVRSEIRVLANAPYVAPTITGMIQLLVVAGSQGSQAFDEVVPDAILSLPDELLARMNLTLQYRGQDRERIVQRFAERGIAANVGPFHDRIDEEIRRSSLIICRAGASFAAEVLAIGRPAIYVPIPGVGSSAEQTSNAQTLERLGAGWYLNQSEMRADLGIRLRDLLGTPNLLENAARKAAALGQPEAASNLADAIQKVVEG